jgi:octaprenyl-diphosphate synthase
LIEKGDALELSEIYEPVQEELAVVEESLKLASEVDSPWLSELLDYSLKGGGKRIRPILALLSSKFYEQGSDSILQIAVAVELMHLATLVHDDTIDNSPVRWGRPTVNKIWGMEKAVLLGDYMFAKAGKIAATTGNLRVIRLFSQTLMILSSGELAQAHSAFNLEQARENYIQRIASKTASLFCLATESGAVLSQAPEESIVILRDYGYNLGVAFQVVDDVLDFIGTEEELGKPVGSDLAQGTLTLPAMLLNEKNPEDNPVKRLFEGGDKGKNIGLAVEAVRNSMIVQECFTFASEYTDKACNNLNRLPQNASRQALIDLADYVITRRR